MTQRVVVVGSLNADLVVGVERRPAAGETVLGGDLVVHPGGKGANQAVAAALLGATVSMIGSVGDDAHGRLLRCALEGAGVDTSGVTEVDRPTGVAVITVTPDGENAIVVAPGANGATTSPVVEDEIERLTDVVVLVTQLEIPLEGVDAAARAAAAHGARLVVNASPPAPLPPGVLALADPLVVNQHELATITGRPLTGLGDARMAARSLRHTGVRSVVVTLGADGALVDDHTDTLVPAPSVPVADTTGAGDAFIGALAAELSAGATLLSATRFAVRAGAAAVQRSGAQPSYARREQLPPA